MSFTWKHGAIVVGCLAIGTAGAAILAKGPTPGDVRIATVASDDALGMMESPLAANVPANTAPMVNTTPTNAAMPSLNEPELDIKPIASFGCKKNGDARRPIQCDARKLTNAWLTVALKRALPASATFTIEAYDVHPSGGMEAPRTTHRYINLTSDINTRMTTGAAIRIAYTPNELRTWNVAAKKLAIAAYDGTTSRWVVLPGVVNQRSAFVEASFATKRLPDQLFALVTKP